MPTENATATDTTELSPVAEALAQRDKEVRKELVKKYKVIGKRRGQLQAHTNAFEKKVAEFEKDVADAANPEQIMAVLATHKFPAKAICLSVSQDD